jgi:hypothetical protein
MVPSAVEASVYVTLGKFGVVRERLKGVEPKGGAVPYWLECRRETESVEPDFVRYEPPPVELLTPRPDPFPVTVGKVLAAGVVPFQEGVPEGIEEALVNHCNVNIRAIRKPAGEVVRTEAESGLRASDDHNTVFIDIQRFRKVALEVVQCIGLAAKSIGIARKNVL